MALFVVPDAVGWLSQDSPSVVASGRKGKAVSVVHVYADALWAVGAREPPNVGFTHKQVYAITTAGGAQSDSDDDEEQQQQQGEETGAEGQEGPGPAEGAEAVDAAMAGLQVDAADAASSSSADDAAPSAATDAAPASSDNDTAAAAAGDEEAGASASGAAATAAGSDSDDDGTGAGDDAQVSASPVPAEDANEGEEGEGAEGDEGEGEGEGEEDDEAEEEDESGGVDSAGKANTSEMDDALLRCFLLAVQTRIRDSDLPLSSSALLTVMESCNVGSAAVDRLEVKRSRYKKLARFIKALGKMGLAKSKMPLCKKGTCVQELTGQSQLNCGTFRL